MGRPSPGTSARATWSRPSALAVREAWDRVAGDYQASHGEHIGREEPELLVTGEPEERLAAGGQRIV